MRLLVGSLNEPFFLLLDLWTLPEKLSRKLRSRLCEDSITLTSILDHIQCWDMIYREILMKEPRKTKSIKVERTVSFIVIVTTRQRIADASPTE